MEDIVIHSRQEEIVEPPLPECVANEAENFAMTSSENVFNENVFNENNVSIIAPYIKQENYFLGP